MKLSSISRNRKPASTRFAMLAALAAFAWAFLHAPAADAAPILLNVDGQEDGGGVFGPNVASSGAAVGFTLFEDVASFRFNAAIRCFDCEGNAFLVRNAIGPGGNVASLVEAFDLSDLSDAAASGATLFSKLPLTSGDYFVLAVATEGFITWTGSKTPNVFGGGRAADGEDFHIAALDFGFPPFSEIVATTGQSFHYAIFDDSLDPALIPAPGAIAIMATGLFALHRMRRRKPKPLVTAF